jgi:hypothetical protein
MNRHVRTVVQFAAVVVAVAGCHYAAVTPPPAPPPPPPPPRPEPSCATSAIVTYDPDNLQYPLTVSAKPITADYPQSNPSDWAICWYLVVRGNDPDPFTVMKLEDVDSVTGKGGGSILVGDQNFQGKGFVRMHFNAEPNASSVTITYKVVGRLKGATTDLAVDPDIIIQKK